MLGGVGLVVVLGRGERYRERRRIPRCWHGRIAHLPGRRGVRGGLVLLENGIGRREVGRQSEETESHCCWVEREASGMVLVPQAQEVRGSVWCM